MVAAEPTQAPREPFRRGIGRVLYSPAGRFRTIVFKPCETKRFGRDERADVRIADPGLRGAHFEVFFDGLRFHAKALGDGGLAVDGKPAKFGEIRSGGFVSAGATTITLHVERMTPAPQVEPSPAESARRAAAEDALVALAPARDRGTLYGALDAARDPRVLALLREGIDEHASLYEGDRGAVLDDVAPYLVRFAPSSRLLERLVREGWGHAWGIFAESTIGAKDVRRHFRRFLMVKDEVTDERLYFRFYDPRVLRDFLEVATPRQREELLSGLACTFVEAESAALLRFSPASAEPPGDEGR